MIAATFALALGAMLLAAFRISGSPVGAGVLVFLGAWFVAIGCALHLTATIDRLALAVGWRMGLKLAAWAFVVGATVWAIARAPGPELLTGLLTVPVLVGVAGILPQARAAALGFLVLALALSAFLLPAAIERLLPA